MRGLQDLTDSSNAGRYGVWRLLASQTTREAITTAALRPRSRRHRCRLPRSSPLVVILVALHRNWGRVRIAQYRSAENLTLILAQPDNALCEAKRSGHNDIANVSPAFLLRAQGRGKHLPRP